MIKEALIQYYQSHKKTHLCFSEGLNVFKGSSDSGKSAIIRALIWLFKNRPTGDDYKSWFMDPKDHTQVTITLSEDIQITKDRGSKTVYKIPGKELEAVRSDVPHELLTLTQINDNNIQGQHEPYYLLQDTAGEVARKLNRFAGLEIIDRLFRNLKSKQFRCRDRINALETNIQNYRSEIEKLTYIDDLSIETETLDSFVTNYEKSAGERATLSSLITSLHNINTELQAATKILPLEPSVTEILSLIRDRDQKLKARTNLSALITNFEKTEADLKEEKEWLEVEPFFLELRNAVQNLVSSNGSRNQLVGLITMAKGCQENIVKADVHAKGLVDRYEDILKKAMICPMCKQNITGETLVHIRETLK